MITQGLVPAIIVGSDPLLVIFFGIALLLPVSASHTDVVAALMLCAPIVTWCWILLQHVRRGDPIATARQRLYTVSSQALPSGAQEAVSFACAGFIGVLALLQQGFWPTNRCR